jgi:hypothetical protein
MKGSFGQVATSTKEPSAIDRLREPEIALEVDGIEAVLNPWVLPIRKVEIPKNLHADLLGLRLGSKSATIGRLRSADHSERDPS